MGERLLRWLLIGGVTLAVVASMWFVPRAVSSGAPAPPSPIELRSEPTPAASPEVVAPSLSVDDRGDDTDDGTSASARHRMERQRTSRESVPDVRNAPQADDDGDDQGDTDDDGGNDDGDGDGDDSDDGGDD
jgi:hypothetical protein